MEIQAQKYSIAQYSSALKRANDDLARTTIRSPMDGVLIQLDTEQGETVVPGSTNLPGSVIMTVGDMSRLLAEVEGQRGGRGPRCPRSDRRGHGRRARGQGSAGRQCGRNRHIGSPRTPPKGPSVSRVKVALDNPDPALRPAMTAKVDILTATSENALTVPVQTVVKRTLDDDGKELHGSAAKGIDESDVVYVIVDGEASARRVVTGVSDVLDVEITDGLSEDEEVITGPVSDPEEAQERRRRSGRRKEERRRRR